MYDHTDPLDMLELAQQVRNFKKSSHPAFLAGIAALDIMRAPSKVLRFTVWGVRKLKGMSKSQAWCLVHIEMEKRDPGHLARCAEDLANHIVGGRDRVDPESFGGLNATEVTKLLGLMKQFGWEPPMQPSWADQVQPVALAGE
jgi:hypothetical protein